VFNSVETGWERERRETREKFIKHTHIKPCNLFLRLRACARAVIHKFQFVKLILIEFSI